MKKVTLILIATLLIQPLFAQILPSGVSMQKGSMFERPAEEGVEVLEMEIDGGYLAFSRTKNKLTFFTYGEDLNHQQTKEVDLSEKGDDVKFVRLAPGKDGALVFWKRVDEEKHVSTLYMQTFDPKTMSMTEEKEVFKRGLDDYDPELFPEDMEDVDEVFYKVDVSDNMEYIMIDVSIDVLMDPEDEESQDVEHFELHVYNSDMEEVWKTEETVLTDEDEKYTRTSKNVTNNGFVVMQARVKLEDEDDEDDTVTKNFIIVASKDNGLSIFEFKIPDQKLSSVISREGKDNKLHVVGKLYNKEEKQHSYYYAILDMVSGEFVSETISEIEDMSGVFLGSGVTSDENFQYVVSKTGYYLFPFVHFKDLFFNPDGGATLVFEMSGFSFSAPKLGSLYFGVAIVKFDEEGQAMWQTGVPKFQYSNKYGNKGSMAYMMSGDVTTLIFNFVKYDDANGDLVHNGLDLKKKSDVYIVRVDRDGESTVELLMEGEKKPFWEPRTFLQLPNNELLFLGENKKMGQLVKIKVQAD